MGELLATGFIGRKVHGVPDETVVARLRHDLTKHVGDGWFALVMFSEGRWVARGADDQMVTPSDVMLRLMERIATVVNVQASEGGHWVVAWKPDENEVWLLWRDGDGDCHIVFEFDAKPGVLATWDDADLSARAGAAIATYREHEYRLGLTPWQKHRRALGETPA